MQDKLSDIRNDYGKHSLRLDNMDRFPLVQLERWLQEAVRSQNPEPTAMTVATVDVTGQPSQRVVLLKEVSDQGVVFYTNYQSRKGQHLADNGKASATFFWPLNERQVRLEGRVEKLPAEESDSYFASRPRESQLGAWASPQSHPVEDSGYLERRYRKLEQEFEGRTIPRPPHWGGYLLMPHLIEFWQGRPGRMHDRFVYRLKENNTWEIHQIAP
ncbi:MAG: pyridoxamine 5'-phosphate oxidase [Marinilabilia sp.]